MLWALWNWKKIRALFQALGQELDGATKNLSGLPEPSDVLSVNSHVHALVRSGVIKTHHGDVLRFGHTLKTAVVECERNFVITGRLKNREVIRG